MTSIEPFPLKSRVSIKTRPVGQPTPPTQRGKGSGKSSLKSSSAKSRSPLLRGLIWGMTFSTTALISAAAGVGVAFLSPDWSLSQNFLTKTTELPGKKAMLAQDNRWNSLLPYHLSRPVNVLVMGIDRVLDAPPDGVEAFAGRSDTMLLLRFEPGDNSLRVLSIPRDTRVRIPDIGYRKINDANAEGGPALAAKVVSQTLNDVPIDRYVRVTTNAFRDLVDLVGGVEVYVQKPMHYRDMTQKLEINLEPGLQTLNGDQAEQFARFRMDAIGDIGRVQRQEILLKSLQSKFNSPAIIPRIPQAIDILQRSVDTNLSMEEILALANFGRQLTKEQVKMVMLPGRFSQADEFEKVSYWILSESGRDRVMDQYFGIENPTQSHSYRSIERLSIALQNTTDDPALVQRIKAYLRQNNFRNIYEITASPQGIEKTEIVAQQGDLRAARSLHRLLGLGQVEASSTGDLASDITIRIGFDAAQWVETNGFVRADSPAQNPR
ncbi:MAG: LCP family protein [Snowella sp.]|nr:LCP family protein [Snowella sp.]